MVDSLGLAQIQDAGRYGVRHLGVTQGGAVDWVAMRWANWLLGNPAEACVLEIPFGGLSLHCDTDATLALTGATLEATLDGLQLESWTRFAVRAGQQLRFGAPSTGVRGYLAAPGGFRAEKILGSVATVSREGLGGLDGQGALLKAGDKLPFESNRSAPSSRRVPTRYLPDWSRPVRLGVVLGAQHSGFSGRSLFALFNQPWQVDSRSDRMGVRLSGPGLRYSGAGLISEGVPLGAIQVPPDGQPIILVNDRQTIGGYPRLGALEPLSVARLAQCQPGAWLHFYPITLAAARARLLEFFQVTEQG